MGTDVVITGLGVLAPNGIGREAFERALMEGRSGIGEVTSFDPCDIGRELAAEVAPFEESAYLRSPKNYLDRNSLLAFAACEMAVRESGATLPSTGREEGISLGTAVGNVESLAFFDAKLVEKGPRFAPPFLFPHTYFNTTVGLLAIEYGLGGPHGCFCTGGLAGLEAIAWAAECVRRGRAGLMIAGGVEALNMFLLRVACGRGLLSPLDGGEEACRPFGLDRNGTVLGEGAAFFVLENAARAEARGARIMGRILGWGRGVTVREAMQRATVSAEIGFDRVDAVFAAAGGYEREDEEEAAALVDVFGGGGVSVIALKGLVGESLGASSPLNLAAALLSLERGVPLPAQARPPELLERMGRHSPRPVRTVLVNAAQPQGAWGTLIVGR